MSYLHLTIIASADITPTATALMSALTGIADLQVLCCISQTATTASLKSTSINSIEI